MAYNGSGTFNRVHSWAADKAGAIVVTASRMDTEMDGFATGLSSALVKDGQQTATARIPFALGTSAMAGSVSSASYCAANDTNTGVYFPATDQVGFTAGGVGVLQATSTGVTVTATTTASSTATGALIVQGGMGVAGDLFANRVNGIGSTPVGASMAYGGTSAPTGWIFGYGQAISRTTYAALFAVYGTTYGAGDGSTTFNVQDFRGRVIAGDDDMGGSSANRLTNADDGLNGDTLGATGGGETQVLAQGNLPNVNLTTTIAAGAGSHRHSAPIGASFLLFVGASGSSGVSGGVNEAANGFTEFETLPQMSGTTPTGGSGTAFGIVQPTIIQNRIIYAGV
jgi:microcystin-dependent protein